MEEIDLKELFTLFWNKKLLIILATLIMVFIGIIYSYFFITPKYTASTNLVLVQSSTSNSQNGDVGITSTDLTINSKLVSTYSDIIKRDLILEQVVSNLNMEKEEVQKIRGKISVNSVKDTEVIEISVRDEDPNYAAQVANEVATVFCEKIVDIFNISNIYLLDRAKVPTEPSNINHIKDIAIFAFMGIVISAMYIFVANMLDTTVKTEEDIEKNAELIVLTSIPNYEAEFKEVKGGKR